MQALPHKRRVCAVLFPRFLEIFCTLVFWFIVSVNFCYACFALQTSGLCSAFPSVPKLFCPLMFVLLFSKFCYACFASQKSGLCSAFPSLPVIVWQACFAGFIQQILLCVHCLSNNCLCSIS